MFELESGIAIILIVVVLVVDDVVVIFIIIITIITGRDVEANVVRVVVSFAVVTSNNVRFGTTIP